jgi:pyruvate/2-oxoglutarate dehydrogenase complex dihydrolipoamide dehydrogenase (E3) component
MARKDAMIKEFAEFRVQQLTSGKFEFIRATARFVDPHTLTLGDGRTITGKQFVVSTAPSWLGHRCRNWPASAI